MLERTTAILKRVATSYVLFVVVGLVVGALVAPVAWNAATPDADGTVAVVPLEGGIDGQSAAAVSSMLQQARDDPDVKAVVVVANSGGGTASGSETLYLQAKRTADQMPMVASVDAAAASGAYYTIAPADTIYAKPSSIVGSVGVLATAPRGLEPNDLVATTGPNKLTGADEREFYAILESDRRAFVGAVFEQRGDRIRISRAEVSEARIWSGSQAVDRGMADEIGDREMAIKRAASLADLDSYRVKVLRPSNQETRFVSRANYLASNAEHKRMVEPSYFTGDGTGPPVILMMPASYVAGSGEPYLGMRGESLELVGPEVTNATA